MKIDSRAEMIAILEKHAESGHEADWPYFDKAIDVYDGNAEPIYSAMREYAEKRRAVNWDKLRAEFFNECVDDIEHPITNTTYPKINLAPHDLFEWFKKKIQ